MQFAKREYENNTYHSPEDESTFISQELLEWRFVDRINIWNQIYES